MHDGRTPLEALDELARDYEILEEIGRGAMAVVYRARERADGRPLAIKLIRARYIQDEETLARCAREARTVTRLQHPNIVTTYGTRTLEDGSLALFMDYVPGRTLRELLRAEGALPAERAARLLGDIAHALVYAHEAGIIHRDIKPENICLDERTGAALLSDFGIAKSIECDTRITHTGATLGTPVYMSPEQIDALPVDERSDLYSLGMVGWEMLAGKRPWAGENLYGVIYHQKHDELPALARLRPEAPASLLAAIEGALRKDREERWESALDFLAQLDPAADPSPTRAVQRRRQRVLARLRAAREAPAPVPEEERTLRFRRERVGSGSGDPGRGGRFRAGWRAAAALVLLLGAGAAAVTALNEREWTPAVAAATAAPEGGEEIPAAAPEPAVAGDESAAEIGAPAPAPPAPDAPGSLEEAAPAPAAAPVEERRAPPVRAPAARQPAGRLATLPGADAEVRFTSARELPRAAAPAARRAAAPRCESARFDPHDQHRIVGESCSVRLVVGESYQMRAAPGPLAAERHAPRSISWSSSNPAVAAVDRDGMVRGLKPGGATISAIAGPMGGTTTVLVVAGPPARPVIVSGDGQAGAAGVELPASLVVRVTDAFGNPLSGVAVSWSVTAGGGLIRAAAARTDEAGIARASWVLGRAPGTQAASAAVAGLPPVTFTAVARAEESGGAR